MRNVGLKLGGEVQKTDKKSEGKSLETRQEHFRDAIGQRSRAKLPLIRPIGPKPKQFLQNSTIIQVARDLFSLNPNPHPTYFSSSAADGGAVPTQPTLQLCPFFLFQQSSTLPVLPLHYSVVRLFASWLFF